MGRILVGILHQRQFAARELREPLWRLAASVEEAMGLDTWFRSGLDSDRFTVGLIILKVFSN